MLTKIEIKNFKCFQLLRLPLRPLTLLSGTNASGKSSALQALVLLHQTIYEHEWSTRLMLNGRTLQLGTVLDVVDKVYGRHGFEIGVTEEDTSLRWVFRGDRRAMSLEIERVIADSTEPGMEFVEPEILRHLIPPDQYENLGGIAAKLRSLTYITAERLGPREVYPLEDEQVAQVVGPRGENTASVLFRSRDGLVRDALQLDGVPPTRLAQIEARMQTFFPGCGLDVQLVPQANAVTLGLRTTRDTGFHRPIHVGFGLTQVLPIVVAALTASERDILLIENPEVHLHPAGQAFMGSFLAEVAAKGTQVVIETHSDHVLNGIRRAVRNGVLASDDAQLHFFRPRDQYEEQVVSPLLDERGNVDAWPEGFFDQFDKDMNYFAGWGE